MSGTCGDIYIGKYSSVFDCTQTADHHGPHRTDQGVEWDQCIEGDPNE